MMHHFFCRDIFPTCRRRRFFAAAARGIFAASGIFAAASLPAHAEEPGSAQWDYAVTKAIASTLSETPHWNAALIYFRDLIGRSQDWNVRLLHAKNELRRGNLESAQQSIDEALAVHPDNPRLWLMAGDIAADSGKTAQAIGCYARVLASQPQNEHAQLQLARQYFAARRWQDVVDLYNRYMSGHEPTSEILVRLSAAYENLGDIKRAEQCLIDNLELRNGSAPAYLPLERFYARQNNEARAKEIAKARAKCQKNDGERNLRKLLPSSR